MNYENTASFAEKMDQQDPLKKFRDEFLIPKTKSGKDFLYFAGNSLGLQPKKSHQYVQEELEDWAKLGVEGHLHARHPWLPYHENLTDQTARLVGAKSGEVVVMNTLSVNLHLMMISFYRPTKGRFKILVEGGAFPSDQYAVASQAKFHGYDPREAIVELKPRTGEKTIRDEDIYNLIKKEGSQIALILLGNVNYLTGQAFNVKEITRLGHEMGCVVGFDFAHGAGNLKLTLHDDGPDFAVWCSYKYLNAGPGALSGCFVHERHATAYDLPRFAGWWGNNKKTRFQMGPQFDPIPGAEGWQLSNPPILQLAVLRASMEIFDQATMVEVRKKGDLLTGYLEFLLQDLKDKIEITTPKEMNRRGCQLSLRFLGKSREQLKVFCESLPSRGIIADFREPDIIRIAPAPLYNRFADVYQLCQIFSEL